MLTQLHRRSGDQKHCSRWVGFKKENTPQHFLLLTEESLLFKPETVMPFCFSLFLELSSAAVVFCYWNKEPLLKLLSCNLERHLISFFFRLYIQQLISSIWVISSRKVSKPDFFFFLILHQSYALSKGWAQRSWFCSPSRKGKGESGLNGCSETSSYHVAELTYWCLAGANSMPIQSFALTWW